MVNLRKKLYNSKYSKHKSIDTFFKYRGFAFLHVFDGKFFPSIFIDGKILRSYTD